MLTENHSHAVTGMVLIHADLPRVLRLAGDGKLQELAGYLSRQIERLKGAGAGVAAIASVLPHICMPQLSGISSLPIIDVIDIIDQHLALLNQPRIALFGTMPVMD